jgi:hypothetical protein
MMLAAFSFTPGEEIFAGLRKGAAATGIAIEMTKPVTKLTSMG